MKSKDLQKLLLSKYENGESVAKICHDLNGGINRATVFKWCKMIRNTDSI